MRRTAFSALLLLLIGLVGCAVAPDATEDVDDSADELSSRKPASIAAFAEQNWVSTGTSNHDGDILSLRLYADGTYVRLRCHGSGCAKAVPETDRFVAFRSKGKTYVDFMSFVRKLQGGEWIDKPVVADTYELKATASGIALRKTYGARWVGLETIDDASLCAASGGTWKKSAAAPDACVCAKGKGYVPGAGGCMYIAISTESACDDTNGSYTDDDATRLGTYCQCGLGRVMTDPGCVDL